MAMDFWTPTNTAIYRKCMRLAAEAGASEWRGISADNRRRILRSKPGFLYSHSAAYWVELWNRYSRGEVGEEEVKAMFLAENAGALVN
jgi:hypothetical protein